jgi:hypothetical protein
MKILVASVIVALDDLRESNAETDRFYLEVSPDFA